MTGIDYSKWDHFDESSSSDGSTAEATNERQAPRVTKFDQPSTITTQADGSIVVQQPEQSSPTVRGKPEIEKSNSRSHHGAIPEYFTAKGGCVTLENGVTIWWSQDRYSVTLRAAVGAMSSQIKYSVELQGALPYSDRCNAVGSNKPTLCVREIQSDAVWFQGELPHPVHYEQDAGDEVDWNILPLANERYMTIVLYKAVPMSGMFVWWKRPFLQCPEQKIKELEDNSSTAFQQAWKQAHEKFQENAKSRQPSLI